MHCLGTEKQKKCSLQPCGALSLSYMRDNDKIIICSIIMLGIMCYLQFYVSHADKHKGPVVVLVILNSAFKNQWSKLYSQGNDPNPKRLICHLKPILKANRSLTILRPCLPTHDSFSTVNMNLKGIFKNWQQWEFYVLLTIFCKLYCTLSLKHLSSLIYCLLRFISINFIYLCFSLMLRIYFFINYLN